VAFAVIYAAQYLKTKHFEYALQQATLWGGASASVYMFVLWWKLRKNPSCAVKAKKGGQ
jgi:hypothetical protein